MSRTRLGIRSPLPSAAFKIGYAAANSDLWSRGIRDVQAALDLLAKSNYHPFDIEIENPTTADNHDLSQIFPFRCEVRRVVAHIIGGTSLTFNLEWRDDDSPGSSGTQIFTVDEVAAAGTEVWTTFTGTPDSGTANRILSLNIAAISGSVLWMRIQGHCVVTS